VLPTENLIRTDVSFAKAAVAFLELTRVGHRTEFILRLQSEEVVMQLRERPAFAFTAPLAVVCASQPLRM
jgi:hypothetical protein